MFRQSLSVFLTLISFGATIYAQDTPERKENKPEKEFTFFFGDEGGSYLGVQTQEVSRENFSKFGLSSVRGVAVEKVLENSPAAQAGLQAGDVILRFNGEQITSVRKLTRLIGEVAPDHPAVLTVSRGGTEREINVTLGKRPAPRFENGSFRMEFPPLPPTPGQMTIPPTGELPNIQTLPPMKEGTPPNVLVWRGTSRQIGVSVAPLTKQLGDYFGVAEGRGLLINDVRENSPASKAGLKAGDVIVEVEGKEVKGNIDLIRAVNEKKEGDVSLTIIRNRNRQTVRVTPEAAKDLPMQFENLFKDGAVPR
jgi:serine protease Do